MVLFIIAYIINILELLLSIFIPDIISFDSPLIKYVYLDLDFFRDRDNALPDYVFFFLPGEVFDVSAGEG